MLLVHIKFWWRNIRQRAQTLQPQSINVGFIFKNVLKSTISLHYAVRKCYLNLCSKTVKAECTSSWVRHKNNDSS